MYAEHNISGVFTTVTLLIIVNVGGVWGQWSLHAWCIYYLPGWKHKSRKILHTLLWLAGNYPCNHCNHGSLGISTSSHFCEQKKSKFSRKTIVINQKWYMSTNFRRSPQYQVSSKSVQSLLKLLHADRHGEAMRHISVNFSYIHTKNKGYKSIIYVMA